MKKVNLKLKSEKGITLISLIITIVIMLIIAGISIDIGMDSLKKTELQGFFTRLDIVQKKIDQIAATDTNYNSLGSSLKSEQINNLNSILSNEGSGLELNVSTFRYFTAEQLEDIWGLSDIKYNVFVDFKTRTVIAEEGLKVDGITYHILPKTVYNVEIDNSKNDKWAVGSLSFSIGSHGKIYYPGVYDIQTDNGRNTIINSIVYTEQDKYIIKVIPYNNAGEEMKSGTLKYKKSDSDFWKTANGLEFIIALDPNTAQQYDVIYEDNNQNQYQAECIVGLKMGYPQILGYY